jgi:hypothetical protein
VLIEYNEKCIKEKDTLIIQYHKEKDKLVKHNQQEKEKLSEKHKQLELDTFKLRQSLVR